MKKVERGEWEGRARGRSEEKEEERRDGQLTPPPHLPLLTPSPHSELGNPIRLHPPPFFQAAVLKVPLGAVWDGEGEAEVKGWLQQGSCITYRV